MELLSDAHPSSLKVSHPRSGGHSFPLTFFTQFSKCIVQKVCIFQVYLSKVYLSSKVSFSNQLKYDVREKDEDKDKDKDKTLVDLVEIHFHQLSLQFPNSQIPKCSTPFLPILITMSICPGPSVRKWLKYGFSHSNIIQFTTKIEFLGLKIRILDTKTYCKPSIVGVQSKTSRKYRKCRPIRQSFAVSNLFYPFSSKPDHADQ